MTNTNNDTVSDLVSDLVNAFRSENPDVNRATFETLDGSRVTVALREKPAVRVVPPRKRAP
jgi:hypothetical protein